MRQNQDSKEKETKIYLFSYYYDDELWGIEISAYDMEDAKKRIQQLPFANYDGELQMRIDVPLKN